MKSTFGAAAESTEAHRQHKSEKSSRRKALLRELAFMIYLDGWALRSSYSVVERFGVLGSGERKSDRKIKDRKIGARWVTSWTSCEGVCGAGGGRVFSEWSGPIALA